MPLLAIDRRKRGKRLPGGSRDSTAVLDKGETRGRTAKRKGTTQLIGQKRLKRYGALTKKLGNEKL